jgi:hypothetical protein
LKVLGMKMLPSNNILLMNPDNLFDTLWEAIMKQSKCGGSSFIDLDFHYN